MELSELTSWLKSCHDDVSRTRCFEEFIRASKNDAGKCTSKLPQMFTNFMLGLWWHDPAYFGENLYFYISVLLFIWSHSDHSSKIYDLFDILVTYLWIFCCQR